MKKSPPNGWLFVGLAVAFGLFVFSRTGKGQAMIQSGLDKLARSERNNNPGNIRNGTAWQGMDASRSDPSFVVFSAPEWGFRAMARILRGYFSRGSNTVRSVIATWAPPNENDTGAYVNAVAKSLNVGPDEKLVFATHLPGLIKAIAKHETGYWPIVWSDSTITKGIELEKA